MELRIGLIIIAALGLCACAGRTAHPIAKSDPNDIYISCVQIEQDLRTNEQEIANRIPRENNLLRNGILAAGGFFLIAPWFAMDLSTANDKEIAAYQDRNHWLRHLAENKHCDARHFPRPNNYQIPQSLFKKKLKHYAHS